MDMYTLFDGVAILISFLVFLKSRSIESVLLMVFFIVMAVSSEIIYLGAQYFNYDLSVAYSELFVGVAVLFGLLSKSHPIVLGYVAYLAIIGFNAIQSLPFYSASIYSVYAIQLMLVFYVRNNNTNHNRSSFFDFTHS